MKQVLAFKALSGGNVSLNSLDDSAHGFSTFMSYFILKAISKLNSDKAIKLIKEYYGGMLSVGATSFFEDFDIDWFNNSSRIDELVKEEEIDIHGDYGRFCYIGLRHSLCHGWSSGVYAYFIEEIIGLKVIEPGFKKIEVKPNLMGLKKIDAIIPTPYGNIEIKINENDVNIKVPKEIELV